MCTVLFRNIFSSSPTGLVVYISLVSEDASKYLRPAQRDPTPTCWAREALEYFRFSSALVVPVDRCSKRQLPGLVSSLYPRRLTHPHYITIRLPLKVILPEHNHTQSKPQTSYIKETVNSLRVYFLLPQRSFRSIHKLKLA